MRSGLVALPCMTVNKLNVPSWENSCTNASSIGLWHIRRTTETTDNRFFQKRVPAHTRRHPRHSAADSAWKHASGQTTSILNSEISILGGELWRTMRATSIRNTKVRALKITLNVFLSQSSTKILTVLILPLLQISATKIELLLQDEGFYATLLLVRYVW